MAGAFCACPASFAMSLVSFLPSPPLRCHSSQELEERRSPRPFGVRHVVVGVVDVAGRNQNRCRRMRRCSISARALAGHCKLSKLREPAGWWLKDSEMRCFRDGGPHSRPAVYPAAPSFIDPGMGIIDPRHGKEYFLIHDKERCELPQICPRGIPVRRVTT